MSTLEKRIHQLSPELQQNVEEYIETLLRNQKPKEKKGLKLDWRGALKDMRDEYTSVELQHKILEWPGANEQ